YSLFTDFSTAYGESPYRIFWFSAVYILWFAVMYGFIGIAGAGEDIKAFSVSQSAGENMAVLFHAFYYSMVTFTTVGYGDLTTVGIGKAVAMMEAYSGPFLVSLFVITIYKRYMER
ncbi:MAG: pentapeptide repeat-containing protein, partial [Nitrospinae bacterium]|nr:pentapeptide repeat-containing protein [Nitrospinota bacterium]